MSVIDYVVHSNLFKEVEAFASKINDKELRQKVIDMLKEPKADLEAPRLSADICPAGIYQHHSYNGGLLQHTLAVTKLSMTLSDLIEHIYGGKVNRDVVIAGALLHDIYKCYTYELDENHNFISSPLGENLDHLSLLVAEMYKRDFPLEVIHVAASHHGEVSPVKPKTIEALIVSTADMTDSEISRKTLRAAEYLLKQSGDNRTKIRSSAEALKLIDIKSKEGWTGIRTLSSKTN